MKREYIKPAIKSKSIGPENIFAASPNKGYTNAKGNSIQLSKGSDFDSEEDGSDTPTDPDFWE